MCNVKAVLLRAIAIPLFVVAAATAAGAATSQSLAVGVTVVSSCAMRVNASAASSPVSVRCSSGTAPRVTIERARAADVSAAPMARHAATADATATAVIEL